MDDKSDRCSGITRTQFERLFGLVEEIRKGRCPNCSQLQRKYEVTRRTILRDISFLKERFNAPIVFDPNRGGYRFTEEFSLVPFFRPTGMDQFTLEFFLQCLSMIEHPPLQQEMRERFYSLLRRGGIHLTQPPSVFRWEGMPQPLPKGGASHLHRILMAMERRRPVVIRYQSRLGNLAEKTLHPRFVETKGGRWLFFGEEIDTRLHGYYFLERIVATEIPNGIIRLPDIPGQGSDIFPTVSFLATLPPEKLTGIPELADARILPCAPQETVLAFQQIEKERCLRIASLLGFSLKDITPAALKPVLWQTIASKYH